MKTILPWCVVMVLLGAGSYLFSQSRRAEAELASLRPQSEQLRRVQAEKEELKRVEGQQDELARLRKDNEELHRLRNEVRQLREQQKQQVAGTGQPGQRPTPTAQSPAGAADQQRLQLQYQQLAIENERLRAENTNFRQSLVQNPQSNSCLNNLQIIGGAKEQWALENRKQVGTAVSATDIQPYLKNGAIPVCSAGGVYTVNAVGTPDTCSVPGHALPR